jgi:manganese transport protein
VNNPVVAEGDLHAAASDSERFRFSWKRLAGNMGPALIVAVAYIDPGNFATNIQGGSSFNYNLLWVVLWSNIMAIILQILSAKLGLVTGRSLPENIRDHFRRPAVWVSWVIAELGAMACDLAEFIGAAIGLNILFGIPMLAAGVLTGVITFIVLGIQKYGHRPLELVIGALVTVIGITYMLEMFLAKPDWGQAAVHTIVPSLTGGSVLVAVGILGATVMPHVIYLHSDLVQPRRKSSDLLHIKRLLKWEIIDILTSMNIAFFINASMVIVSAAVFFKYGMHVNSIQQAHQSLTPLLGSLSSFAFAIALLASGISSSAVGTIAGQVIMKGFVNFTTPLWLRRLVTMLPSLIVIYLGIDPLKALVISQVSLSFALPFAIIPLLLLTGRPKLMRGLVNSPRMKWAGWTAVSLIILLNCVLLYFTFTGSGA